MLTVLTAVAFAGCVLLDLAPGTEVDCHMGVPLATWATSPAPSGDAPAAYPAPPPPTP